MPVTCQTCGEFSSMHRILNLGYMPPPNEMPKCNQEPRPQEWYPTELWFCTKCELAQIGYIPDQTVAFPDDYPYTSGATPALKKNFEELRERCDAFLKPNDLVVDIGSNDGTLLSCFKDRYKVLGIEPTAIAYIAQNAGIWTERAFFTKYLAEELVQKGHKAKLITCANCFAHMPEIHTVVEGIKTLLHDDGIFISESHYLIDLVDKLQYDTIYAEHLRYYSISSLYKLLDAHGLYIFKVEHTDIHGGSIRVYASKNPRIEYPVVYAELSADLYLTKLQEFAAKVQYNKTSLVAYLHAIKFRGGRIVGIGAPSRASTVINYLRLDSSTIDYICEQSHSLKLGRFMPGTDIAVWDERRLYEEQPDAAILFSWHLADQLVPKIRAKGYRGDIILPCSVEVLRYAEASVA